MNTNDDNTLLVAKPVAFTAPADDEGANPSGAVQNASTTRVHLPGQTFNQQWQAVSRFAGKPFEGLQLDAAANRDSVPPGKPVEITLALRNRSGEPILVKKWQGDSDYEHLVRDAADKPVPLSEGGKMFFQTGSRLDIRELKPGESITAALPVAGLFAFPATGEYTVLASLPVLGDVDAVLTANPVQIHVEKPAEPNKAGSNAK
jgi:hypothetical protein